MHHIKKTFLAGFIVYQVVKHITSATNLIYQVNVLCTMVLEQMVTALGIGSATEFHQYDINFCLLGMGYRKANNTTSEL